MKALAHCSKVMALTEDNASGFAVTPPSLDGVNAGSYQLADIGAPLPWP